MYNNKIFSLLAIFLVLTGLGRPLKIPLLLANINIIDQEVGVVKGVEKQTQIFEVKYA